MRNLFRHLLAAAGLACLLPVTVDAADIRVFAINPLRGPFAGLAETFSRDTGHHVEIVFGAPPALIKRLTAGESADLVVFAQNSLEGAMKTGRLGGGSTTEIGRAGVGVVVRAGTAAPNISTADALKKALLDADSLVFNQLASGRYFATVVERLGITDQIKAKTKRPEADADVFEHMRNSKGKDIGILSLPAIMADGGKTVRMAGPLPGQLQHYEPYLAALTVNAKSPDAAKAFVAFLTSPQTRATLAKRGVEQTK